MSTSSNMFDPRNRGDQTLLVDHLIGTAYQTVKDVADNLDFIRYLAANLTALREGLGSQGSVILTGTTPAVAGGSVNLDLPDDIDTKTILGSLVQISGADGTSSFSEASGLFTHSIQGRQLVLTINAGVTVDILNTNFFWTILYKVGS